MPACVLFFFFFFSSRRRHTRFKCDWSSDVCSSDLAFIRPWFLVAVGAAAFIVLTGAALGGLAGAEVWPYLAPIFRLLAPVLEAIFLVLFFFASLIARLIFYLLSLIPRRWVPPRPVMNDPTGAGRRA